MSAHAIPSRIPLATKPMGILASLGAARRNLLSVIPEIATRQPMISGRTGIRWHMIMDPGAIRRVLLEQVEDYPKSQVTKSLLKPAIGDSLFIAEGSHWRWQRRAASPVFSHRNMMNLSPIMTEAAVRSCERIANSANRPYNIAEEMVRTTFDVIAEVTFSGDAGFDANAVHQGINNYIKEAGKMSLMDILGVPAWVPRPGRFLNSRKVLSRMRRIADASIEARRVRGRGETPDLLDLLMKGEDPETHRRMNTAELRDNLLTFIVAGHETTALTLAWALYLCAFDQSVQSRVRDELSNVCGDGPVLVNHVGSLNFARCVIDEALRLYPPASLISRTAMKNDTICGREIKRGDIVIIPIYAVHRHHNLWTNPDAFIPDRFADSSASRRYAYLPFGDGPRICIGASFAIQEATIILGTLLNRFKFTLAEGHVPSPVMIMTLRPGNGIWLNAAPISRTQG